MKKPINVTWTSMPSFQEYTKEIEELWDSRWLSNRGVKHIKLENLLIEFLGAPNIALFANGHLGLELAIEAFHLSGEVITTPFTHVSTTHSIIRNRLKPVFCDINPLDYTIDPDLIEEKITEQTTAIVATHVYGHLCDIQKIDKIAKKYNLRVIYDAAHAFGVELQGVNVARFGDASMFSLHATKVFNTIEGGIVAFQDEKICDNIQHIINFGFTSHETIDFVGTNARMNEFEAAMGICNLRHFNDEVAKRKRVYYRYVEQLENIEGIRVVLPKEDIKYNFSYLPVVFDKYKESRDQIIDKLKSDNIFARKYFYPLTSEATCYNGEFDSMLTPIAKDISVKILTLPLYSDLDLEDVERICKIIKE